jgi:serine/threonine protein kinase
MPFEPSSFGRYVLLKRIAIGGMAEIFRAMAYGAEGFEKLVAIKRMLPHLSSDHQFVDMFVNEAKLAANLNHVNIVPIYDFGCIENMLFLSMEYVHGKDISEITRKIKSRRLHTPVELACHIFIEVLNGLHNAHSQRDRFGKPLNIVHRDMSPPNIIVSYDGEVKIADFGIAKASRSKAQTSSGVLKGKYSYMSPEQAQGKPLDHRTDIFSLGICFYEMLTLSEMFIGHSELEVLRKVREASFKPPTQLNSAIPKELEAIILRALEKNPADRYPSAADWRNELEGFLVSKNLRFSTSGLSGFMNDMFKEDIFKEERDLANEAELAEKLRPEARHIAKMEASAAGELDTLVLGKDEEGWPPGLDKRAFADVDEEDDEEETVRVELSELDQGPAYEEDDLVATEVESAREEMETLKARRLAQYRVRYDDLDKDLDTSPPTMESESLPRRTGVAEDKIPARLPPRPRVKKKAPKTVEEDESPSGIEDLFEDDQPPVPLEPEGVTGEFEEYTVEEDRKKKTMLSYLVLVVVGAVLGGGLVALLLSSSGSPKTEKSRPAAVTPVEVAKATPTAAEAEKAEEARRAREAEKAAEEAKKAEEARKAEEAAKTAVEAQLAEEARKAEEAKKVEEARKADEAAKAAALLKKAEEEKKKKTVKKSKKKKKRRKRYTSRKRTKRRRKYASRSKKKRYKKKKTSRRKTKKSRRKPAKEKVVEAPESAGASGGNTLYIDGINVKTLPGLGKKLRPGVHIMELRNPDGKVLRRWRVRVKEEGESK